MDYTPYSTPPTAPLVSFIVFAYNQQDIVHDTIASAFAQDYPNLEIILSDDCSTDDTFGVMQRMAAEYHGPHSVRLNRNDPNMGLIGHVNHSFDLANGELIVVTAGDDYSVPHRTSALHAKFVETGALLIHSDMIRKHDPATGKEDVYWSVHSDSFSRNLRRAAASNRIAIGASCAWHPDLMKKFGPITRELAYEDLILPFRALVAGSIAHVPEALVHYRIGMGISTSRPASREERMAQIRRRREAKLAAFEQKLDDCRKVDPGRRGVLRTLKNMAIITRQQLEADAPADETDDDA